MNFESRALNSEPLSLSTHVLDTERGTPARGLFVRLSRRQPDGMVEIDRRATDSDGRVRDCGGEALTPGEYQIAFEVGGYLQSEGRDAPFLQEVVVAFKLVAGGGHYHVPLLMTRFSGVIYRGT